MSLGTPVQPGLKELPALQEQVQPEPQVLKETVVRREPPDFKVIKEVQALRVLPVLVQQEPQVLLEISELRGQLVSAEQPA